jgi:RNA polymerase sigma-70 factor (ECF subfamily)
MLSMDSTSPSLLLRLRQPGDRPAWQRFVDLYTPLLYSWARRMSLQEEDSADLIQDVLLTLLQKLPEFQYDRHKSFRAWLRTVAVNRWRDTQRRRAAALRGGQDGPLAELAVPGGAEAWWEAEYQRHLFAQAARLMRSDFQEATWKACWALVVEGRPGAEVAAELGLSLDAVYAATSRVLRRLRQELDGLLD